MIEKTIHYVWLGNKEIPEKHYAFIRGWQELHPDWEIIKWSENNFDCKGNSWVKIAIEQGNWALAADVIRSYVLLNHGGVYLDTDVELFKSLNELAAENDFFIGYETDFWFGCAVLGAKKGHRIMREVYERYLTPCEKLNTSSNMLCVLNFSSSIKRLYNPKLDGKTKKIQDNALLLSTEYFFPKNYITHRIKITENTIAMHHLSSIWFSFGKRIGIKIARGLRLILGKFLFGGFERIARINMLGKLNREYKKKCRKNKS
ncbi:MAG: hypothetical protein FWG89_03455 [Treponema sp.]|nr:hypothetical protein [Treponema sp.]